MIATRSVIINLIVFKLISNKLHVMLIRNLDGTYALPSSYVQQGESLKETQDSIQQRISIQPASVLYTKHLATSEVRTRLAGECLSLDYVSLRGSKTWGKTPSSVKHFPIDALPKIHQKYKDSIYSAREHLVEKTKTTNLVVLMTADTFTLATLHGIYQNILDEELNLHNFRRNIVTLDILDETEKLDKTSKRAAKVYRSRHASIVELPKKLSLA